MSKYNGWVSWHVGRHDYYDTGTDDAFSQAITMNWLKPGMGPCCMEDGMSTYYWERFVLNGRSDEMLRLDDKGEVYDLNGDGGYKPNEERWRYRTPGKPEDGNWMFLQNVDGIWIWWDWTVEDTGYHHMPAAHTLEEAQAAAVAMWRTL